jgi:hypothetical protein
MLKAAPPCPLSLQVVSHMQNKLLQCQRKVRTPISQRENIWFGVLLACSADCCISGIFQFAAPPHLQIPKSQSPWHRIHCHRVLCMERRAFLQLWEIVVTSVLSAAGAAAALSVFPEVGTLVLHISSISAPSTSSIPFCLFLITQKTIALQPKALLRQSPAPRLMPFVENEAKASHQPLLSPKKVSSGAMLEGISVH